MKTLRKLLIAGLLLSIAYTCGKQVNEQNVADFQYKLYLMQEKGRIDSVIMTEALTSSDDAIRSLAVVTCGIVRDKRFTSYLSDLCSDKNMIIRSNSIFALGEIKDSSAVSTLAALLHDENEAGNLLTIEAIGKIGDKSSAKYIRPLLKYPDAEIASESAYALWRLADTLSIGDLKSNLSRNDDAAIAACYALFRMAPDSCAKEFYDFLTGTTSGEFHDYGNLQAQSIAIRGLGASNDTILVLTVLDSLYDNLHDPSKVELFRALGNLKIGHKQLESLLPDMTNNGLKRETILALGQIGSTSSYNVIKKFFDDPSLQVRTAAISVIPDVNKKSPTGTLTKYSKDKSWQIRAEVASALGKVESRKAEKALKLMLEDKDDRVKASAIDGLRNYRISKNIDIIKAALYGSKDRVVKSLAADVLGNSENKRAMNILIDFAAKQDSTSDIDVVRALIDALSNYIDSTDNSQLVVESLTKFLDHSNRIVRKEAYQALGENAPVDFNDGEYQIDFSIEDLNYLQAMQSEHIIAEISTEKGVIEILLLPGLAPRTVANFLKLAERRFYDGLIFHRVVENFVIQGGCPRGDGWGDPGYMIREEINRLPFKRGVIGMATSGRDTGGSQFFICLTDQPHLDGRYTTFGHIYSVECFDVIDQIEIGDKINSITIKRGKLNESGTL